MGETFTLSPLSSLSFESFLVVRSLIGSLGAALMLFLQLYLTWWIIVIILGSLYVLGFATVFLFRREQRPIRDTVTESDALVQK